jgi:small subunit ribosomal protein S2e
MEIYLYKFNNLRIPVTKLGRLVKESKIKTIEEIYLYSFPIKEYQIVDRLISTPLKDEVMKIMPVQKQTRAGQRTRFKVIQIFCILLYNPIIFFH